MTTITTPTPTPIRTHHVRAVLLAVLAALVATTVVLGTWTLIDTQTSNPTTITPAATHPSTSQLSLAETMIRIEAALPPSVYVSGGPGFPLPAPAPEMTVADEVAMMQAALAGYVPQLDVGEEVAMIR